MAAQLHAAAERDIDGLSETVADGDFQPLHEWLSANVHQYGARFETNELVKQATGEEFVADHFLNYVETKYSDLYDL
jgi:carboxypeptidase Taq (EC:3.4.17.19). Metallo peptidase. MEROPS family M32